MATKGKSASGNLSSSLTDLMTSLMVIFVLLLVATLNNASAQGETTRNRMLDKLKDALQDFAAKGVRVEKDPTDPLGLLVLVPEKFFNFAVDKSVIPSGGVEFLENFAPRLAATACSEEYRSEINSIVVEGHTDSTGSDEHNVQLSQARSLAVVQTTLEILGSRGGNQKSCFLQFLSASGVGSTGLIRDASGQEDKDRSRRVEFKIRVRSLEQREIRKLLGM